MGYVPVLYFRCILNCTTETGHDRTYRFFLYFCFFFISVISLLIKQLPHFKHFVQSYLFPIIVICVSKLTRYFRLSGYETFHSLRSNAPSRLMLCVRKDMVYVHHTIPEHCDNKYIGVALKNKTNSLNVIAAYLVSQAALDGKRLEGILESHFPPFILTGDFNDHHPIRGRSHMNCRTRDLSIMTDGTPT